MFALTAQHRFFLYTRPCDMRKGIYGLSGIVRNDMHRDPLSGDIYVFINRARQTMKLLLFESDGFLLYTKRLEAGRFQKRSNDQDAAQAHTPITYQELHLILQGIDLRFIKKRKRFSFKKTA